jgi:uncharacterized protein YbjT (DUF2867 family)
MTILVTGATGNVGREVVRSLREAGAPVRALTRNPAAARFPDGVEVVAGDLLRPESLVPALTGATALHLFAEPSTVDEVVALAKQAGVRRIVVLSSESVTDNPDDAYHGAVERAAEQSGLEWTHVRPGEFALNKVDTWAGPIRAGSVRLAYPDAKNSPVHEADIGAVAAAALTGDGHAGRIYRPTAADVTTQREQIEAIGAAIGRPVHIELITPEEERDDLRQVGYPDDLIDYIHDFLAATTVGPVEARPDVELATGRPARTFARWAIDHADDFR